MPSRGKKRGRGALKDTKEPAFKVAKSEISGEGGESVPVKTSGERNPGKTSAGEASTKGTKKTYTHWLMKSEPESRMEKGVDVKFGIEDLKAQLNQTACWDGVRNYQARNFLREMKVGQMAFFYHSNCKEPGIAGIVKVVKEAYPDHTQFESKDPHYDASSSKENPKWCMVDVQFVRMTKRFIPLAELKLHHQAHKISGGALKDMTLFTRQRLSVQPLTVEEFEFVLSLEEEKQH
ncbi:thymocyte nuclear protein 1 isoform X1 [Sphaerodactylus townsendi]|uniref:thymocyte nuclear protein 1 isoform X1 n=1 Tax=Sphaerodactylus townsendi TaxID=933632 RepID=UPI002025B8C6|nr:thymocyte nuclear protein 1 isoform X1 [Sphaerodactylus townsendi]XP_048369190.1 thymocyte nuclear protein 1 isoform X1 [Sphaerodactylus townsendi]XP_048369191.1 thymocyte nuclear protein 1 isoform X1 [Sphaerodactylus townsendi]XP_048369192.1 thymocyte nuclear protein 1 isoform X1 [Sphaerodactylus townsendi]